MKRFSLTLQKTSITSILLPVLLCVALSSNAQEPDTSKAEARAKSLTEKMKNELSLTEQQYPKVYSINLKYARENQRIIEGPGGKLKKYKVLKTSQNAKDKEMKGILTNDQYKKYEDMVEEMKKRFRRG